MTQSLTERFAALQAERDRSWTDEQLARNAGQRKFLAARHDPAHYPQPGDAVPAFTLIDQDGRELTRDQLLTGGPAVLIFFRFGGCPACNIALPYYHETLWPALRGADIPLVAVSAQIPVDRSVIDRHGLGYSVASDPGYALSRALGISFFPEEQPQATPGTGWIGETLGTNSYEIDQPAVLVIAPDATVRFFEVSPDWMRRTESGDILAHLPEATVAVA